MLRFYPVACQAFGRHFGQVHDAARVRAGHASAACGLSYAVADAPGYVKNQANSVLEQRGGYGAFRELAGAILLAREGPRVQFGGGFFHSDSWRGAVEKICSLACERENKWATY